jgi:hypothetical protein
VKFLPFILVSFALTFAARAAESLSASNDWRELWLPQKNAEWRQKSEAEIRTLAEKGNPIASYLLAKRLWASRAPGDEGDRWMAKSEAAGFAPAIYQHAGFAQSTNHVQAVQLFEAASATGYPPALIRLADAHIEGREVKLNLDRAIRLFQSALDAGSLDAMVQLARFYSSGVGEPRNENETPVQLLRRAEKEGYSSAYEALADRYRYGNGVEKNMLESAGYSAKAFLAVRDRTSQRKTSLWGIVGPEEQFLARLVGLYDDAIVNASAKAVAELAGLHLKNDLGLTNPARAAALNSIARQMGADTSKFPPLEKTLDPTQHAAYLQELNWLKTLVTGN